MRSLAVLVFVAALAAAGCSGSSSPPPQSDGATRPLTIERARMDAIAFLSTTDPLSDAEQRGLRCARDENSEAVTCVVSKLSGDRCWVTIVKRDGSPGTYTLEYCKTGGARTQLG